MKRNKNDTINRDYARVRVGRYGESQKGNIMEHNDVFGGAKCVEDVISHAREWCNKCKQRGSACSGCDYDTDEKIRQKWDDLHPTERSRKKPDSGKHDVKVLSSLHTKLRERFKSGVAKIVFMAIAHHNGVPDDIKYVEDAKIFAQNNKAKYGRQVIAYYMCKDFNTGAWKDYAFQELQNKKE